MNRVTASGNRYYQFKNCNKQNYHYKHNRSSFDTVQFSGKNTDSRDKPSKWPLIALGMTLMYLGEPAIESLFNDNPPAYSLKKIDENSIAVLKSLKFPDAAYVYDISNIIQGEKLSPESMNYYTSLLKSKSWLTYRSEKAAKSALVLTLAANSPANSYITDSSGNKKNLSEDIKPYIVRGIKTRDPDYYAVGSVYSKLFKDQVEYDTEPKRPEGFLENVKDFFGDIVTGEVFEDDPYFNNLTKIGSLLDRLDNTDAKSVLVSRGDLPWELSSDNKAWGSYAVGFAIRDNLDPAKFGYDKFLEEGQKTDKEFLKNPENRSKFIKKYLMTYENRDSLMDKRIVDMAYMCIMINHLDEAIHHNQDHVNSGYAAFALDLGGYMNREHELAIKQQIVDDANNNFLGIIEKMDVESGLKLVVLAKRGIYGELPPEATAKVRKLMVKHPDSFFTGLAKLARDLYDMQIKKEIDNTEKLVEKYTETLNVEDSEKDPQKIIDASDELDSQNVKLLAILEREIEEEELADPEGNRLKSLMETKGKVEEQQKLCENNKKIVNEFMAKQTLENLEIPGKLEFSETKQNEPVTTTDYIIAAIQDKIKSDYIKVRDSFDSIKMR